MLNAAKVSSTEKQYPGAFQNATPNDRKSPILRGISPFQEFLSWDEAPLLKAEASFLDEAKSITEKFNSGASMTRVASAHDDITQFAIGHMISNIIKKKLVKNNFRDMNDIYDAIAPGIMTRVCRHAAGTGAQVGRTAIIEELCACDILEEKAQIRQIKPAGTTPSIRDIGVILEETTKFTIDQITSTSRERGIVAARFKAIWIMRHVCGHPLSVIGRSVGGRDHTTVLNSLNKIAIERKADEAAKVKITWLCERADAIGVKMAHSILRHQENGARARK